MSILSAVAASILGSVAGCNCNKQGCCDKHTYNDPFFKTEYSRTIEKVGRQQAASAARK